MQPRAKPQLLLPSLMACLLTALSLRADEATGPKNPLPAKPQSLITISKETTYLTEPLTQGGYVDYVEALNRRMSEGVTTENNAVVLFWKALGPEPVAESIRQEFFEKLSIPCPSEEGEYFVNFGDFAEKELGVKHGDADAQDLDWLDSVLDQQDRAMHTPWTADHNPMVADWLTANQRPLRRIVEGTRRSRYYNPLLADGDPPRMLEGLLPGVDELREAARALRARAMLKLGSGKIDAAWQDLLACHRLARLVAQGPSIVEGFVAISIDGIACEADQLLAYHARPTAKQAAAMRDALLNLPPLPDMARKVDRAERFTRLDAVGHVARKGITALDNVGALPHANGWLVSAPLGDSGDDVSIPQAILDPLTRRMIDWDAILRKTNRWYDRFVAAMSKPNWAKRQAAIDRLDEKLEKLAAAAKYRPRLTAAAILTRKSVRNAASEQIANLMLARLTPPLQAVVTAEGRARMTADLTAVSLALAGYHGEHGEYPDRLAALAPQYFPEVPKDRFTGAPLHYRREGQGSLLYSVGPNQKDDDGHTREDAQRQQPPDAAVNITEGPVWDDITVRVPPRKDD